METNYLYLKTAFCCMACDGDIADEETRLIGDIANSTSVFDGLDIQVTLNSFVTSINTEGQSFLMSYLDEIADYKLDIQQELNLAEIAIKTIEADKNIEYSEVSFFKKIREKLSFSDKVFLQRFPDKEDYILPDINDASTDSPFFSFDFAKINLNL